MTGHEIRRTFLDYFQRQGHTVVPSASLVPEDDPTLLFTGAGMNQFKDYFLGKRKDMRRAASCQKCFRTPDLEHVGKTASHLTFFEMLGNFSFGDYFKPEAIRWGWEFLTREMKLPAEKLWVTVYEQDEEAFGVWRDQIKVSPARIVKLGAKDNFWPSNAPTDGPNGPCGPCSELHFDYGMSTPGQLCPDPKRCQPGCACGRFVEVWNLVFTQFDRQPDGSLAPLPAKNIDTGMGLERLTAVVNGLRTNFETDLLEKIVSKVQTEVIEANNGRRYSDRELVRISPDVRAIADHARALTFLIADDVSPANDSRGYVLRMLLRKAVGHGRLLGIKEPFLHRIVPTVAYVMNLGYPHLIGRQEHITKVVLLEEERYQQTLEEKLPLLERFIELKLKENLSLKDSVNVALDSYDAARFRDTHGLSYEEISRTCREYNILPPSKDGFERALAALQTKSKSASQYDGAVFAETFSGNITELGVTTMFVGDDSLRADGKIVALLKDGRVTDRVHAPANLMVVLDITPFYGESGGQLGDRGTLQAQEGMLIVEDTKRVDQTIVHSARLTEGQIKIGDPVQAVVDLARRRQVTRNHTATHLLHAALRTILGSHVHQAGSLVAPDRLRFDFTSAEAVPAARLQRVEEQVNEWAFGNFPVKIHVDVPIEKAKEAGALAFFGDKYGDRVRMVEINGFSKELCGGTHLRATGEVGLLTIVDEGSVASGVRRIEALTGEQAVRHLKGAEGQLLELAQLMKTPREKLSDAVERLRQQTKSLQQELDRLKVKDSQSQAKGLIEQATRVNGITVIAHSVSGADMGQLRQLTDALRAQTKDSSIVCLGSAVGDAVFLVAGSSSDLAPRGVTAQALIGRIAPVIGGKGGGRPDFAQAGGRDPSKLAEALKQVVPVVEELSRSR